MKNFMLILLGLSLGMTFGTVAQAELDLEACIGAWLFDEGKGNKAEDASGKNNHGKIDGAKWVKGKFGQALDFNGKGDFVEIPDSDSLTKDIEEISILAWAHLKRVVTQGTWNALVGKNPYPSGYLMWLEVPAQPSGLVYSPARHDDRANSQLELKKWYHLGFTRAKKGDMKFYIDGKLITEAKSAAGPIATKPAPIMIAGQSGQTFEGLIDEVMLFNQAIDAKAIGQLMKQGFDRAFAVNTREKLAVTWGRLRTVK